eukprot:1278411-Pleurochrysis_carterae.AAC.1
MAKTILTQQSNLHQWSPFASLACHEPPANHVARPKRTCSHCKQQNSPATVPGARHMMILPSRRCYQALSDSPASPSNEGVASKRSRAPARRHIPRLYKWDNLRKDLRQHLV